MAEEFKAKRILAGDQPGRKLEQLIVSRQSSHFAAKLALPVGKDRVEGHCPRFKNHALTLAHDLKRNIKIIAESARRNLGKQFAAHSLQRTRGPDYGTGC